MGAGLGYGEVRALCYMAERKVHTRARILAEWVGQVNLSS